MDRPDNRTPERVLIVGCTSFAGLDSVAWTDQIVPNLPDYDLIIVSVPHITKEYLAIVKLQFFEDMRKALVRFLHSGGKLIVLVSAVISVPRPKDYPQSVSNIDWCPISYVTPNEAGKSIIIKSAMYEAYLNKMVDWNFYISVPKDCLSKQLTDVYGETYNTRYNTPFEPFIENRYGRALAGQFVLEVRREQRKADRYGSTYCEYPEKPDFTTGQIVLLPLIEKVSAEEALASILHTEIGYSVKSVEPDWVQEITMPFVGDLKTQIAEAEAVIMRQREAIEEVNARIANIHSFRRLIYGTGFELEDIVKESLECLGAKVTPAKYAQEEYILEVDGIEHLMEVKGVTKSITLKHLRQLNDYLLKYQEDTGKDCKGILFGNAWRDIPPHLRGCEETRVFPDNVIKRAEEWGISLVSSTAYFNAFIKTLEDATLSRQVLITIITARGVAEF